MDAYERAIRLLAVREHTGKEIRQKLSAKGYSAEEIDSAVLKLIAEKSLSEERFAESYIRSRLRKSPEGKPILRMRLKEKGTPSDVADSALSDSPLLTRQRLGLLKGTKGRRPRAGAVFFSRKNAASPLVRPLTEGGKQCTIFKQTFLHIRPGSAPRRPIRAGRESR